jgi:D-beta-D-heptose 7-phosphate kinase/D-beta-D-heptose 1-phosphate adenosyltransferase
MNDNRFDSVAAGYLSRFSGCRLLVVGDIMLDEYVWGAVRRISPEAPVPVVAVRDESHVLGGAANVAVNIAGLGAKSHIVGLIGNDGAGRDILKLLRARKIGVSGIVADPARPTTLKTRVIAHNQQIVRVDRELTDPVSGAVAAELLRNIAGLVPEVDGIVLSDYRKGMLSRELVSEVNALAKRHGVFVAVDPKRSDFGFYAGCTIITPNKSEAEAAMGGHELSGDAAIAKAGRTLVRKARASAVLITRGEEGMTLVEKGRAVSYNVPALARQVFDVTGAGDTVIATLAVALGAKVPIRHSVLLSNVAAGVVVGEVGTSPITMAKLRHALAQRVRDNELENDNPGGRA